MDAWLNSLPVPVVIGAFAAIFIPFWLFVIFILSRVGWARYAAFYRATGLIPSDARRFSAQSIAIGSQLFGSVSYGNCVTIWLSRDAIFLRPMLLFRAFHPLLRIPFADIRSIERRQQLWVRSIVVELPGDRPNLQLMGRASRALVKSIHALSPSKLKGLT